MPRTLPILLEATVSSDEHCDRGCMFLGLGSSTSMFQCSLPVLWGQEPQGLSEDKVSELPRRTHSCRIVTGQKP